VKIAIPAGAPDMNARVENRLGTAPWLLVIDGDSLAFEAVEGPSRSAGPGAGIQAVTLVLGMGARVLLAGTISPGIAATLRKNGIEVITGVSGSVQEVLDQYRRGDLHAAGTPGLKTETEDGFSTEKMRRQDALTKTSRQFAGILPVLLGVILLVGLFRSFVPRELLLSLFPGNAIQDSIFGTLAGSLMAGNPINSYVLGETLLEMGVSLFGAVAFMLAWVNIGLVQLPAEIAALGAVFAGLRNLAAFIMVILVAVLTVVLMGLGL
jgi:predicted Fe-Mo cluster-binding NifX family protein